MIVLDKSYLIFMTAFHFYVKMFRPSIFLAGMGTGLSWITYVVSVSCYFRKKRGIAQALAFCGGGCSYLVFPFMYKALLDTYTWRGTLWILAGLWLNCCVMGALIRPVPIRPLVTGKSSYKSVLKKWTFYFFIVAHLCFHVDMLVFTIILPDHVRQSGHSRFKSGLLLSVLGAPIIPVRVLGNLITDRNVISPTLYMTLILILMAVTSFIFPLSSAYWYEALVSGLRGATMAILVPLAATVCADIFGGERMTAAFGLAVLADGLAGLVGPALAGETRLRLGFFNLSHCLDGMASLASAWAMARRNPI